MEQQQSLWSFIIQQRDKLFSQTIEHIGLTFISLLIAVIIGLPLGIIITKRKDITKQKLLQGFGSLRYCVCCFQWPR